MKKQALGDKLWNLGGPPQVLKFSMKMKAETDDLGEFMMEWIKKDPVE